MYLQTVMLLLRAEGLHSCHVRGRVTPCHGLTNGKSKAPFVFPSSSAVRNIRQ
jgi:hypothetical protein